MKRVIVIGCPGSGKSFFARKLHKLIGYPIFHLDNLYWNSDRSVVPKEEFLSRHDEAMLGASWIIDGNYNSTMECRMSRCDTVFFFDLPSEVCLDGIRSRRGKVRPDIPWVEGEDEEDEEFVSFVRCFRDNTRPQIIELLGRYSDRRITIFTTRAEADEYLNKIKNELI